MPERACHGSPSWGLVGPLLAGVLLDAVSARATIAVFAASGLVLAICTTLSPSIRAAPSLDELAANVADR